MSRLIHSLYLGLMLLITVLATAYLTYVGYSFYSLPLSERFYHPQYDWFKASGTFGHGLGIVGTLLILFGVVLYVTAKKYGYLERLVRLKYLLEFHIFLCTLGPILVLFHTAFKFGGIISIGFWSMALVVLSGVIGRYIYLQIPRTISGRELSLREIHEGQGRRLEEFQRFDKIPEDILQLFDTFHNPYNWGWKRFRYNRRQLMLLSRKLKSFDLSPKLRRSLLRTMRAEISLKLRIQRLALMQRLFKYWHVAHRPFALIMLVVVAIHVFITIGLGYRWLF